MASAKQLAARVRARMARTGERYAVAGFTHLGLVQIGGDRQEPFLEWSRTTLVPAWREAFGG